MWVRGYGLVDSPKSACDARQARSNLKAVPAPDARAAAAYYPAGYWFSLLKVPDKSEFPGTGLQGNGISPNVKSQADWHPHDQVGNVHGLPPARQQGHARDSRRVQVAADELRAVGAPRAVGPGRRADDAARSASSAIRRALDDVRRLDRPHRRGRGAARRRVGRRASSATSSSPSGTGPIRRRTCTTSSPPTGAIRASTRTACSTASLELSADYLPVLDPVHNTIESRAAHRARHGDADRRRAAAGAPSAYWGDDGAVDEQGERPQPDDRREGPRVDHRRRASSRQSRRSARQGSSHPSAKLFPLNRSGRQLAMYDPKTKKLTHISTCFSTHHLMFAEDANHTLWTSGGGPVGRLARHEEVRRDGRRGGVAGMDRARPRRERQRQARRVHRAEPAGRSDEGPAHQRRALRGLARARRIDLGLVARLPRRRRPPRTRRAIRRRRRSPKYFEPPYGNPKAKVQGFSPRGMDIDRNGVAWVALASGHMASFDRRKCTGPLNGPTATGQHCPEGWTLYTEPLPQLKGVTENGSAEGELLHLGRSVRRARARQEHADQHRQRVARRCSR